MYKVKQLYFTTHSTLGSRVDLCVDIWYSTDNMHLYFFGQFFVFVINLYTERANTVAQYQTNFAPKADHQFIETVLVRRWGTDGAHMRRD